MKVIVGCDFTCANPLSSGIPANYPIPRQKIEFCPQPFNEDNFIRRSSSLGHMIWAC